MAMMGIGIHGARIFFKKIIFLFGGKWQQAAGTGCQDLKTAPRSCPRCQEPMYNRVHVCGLLVCGVPDSHNTFDVLATKVLYKVGPNASYKYSVK